MKQRALKVIKIGTALLLGGLVYALICNIIGFALPCIFNTVTGLQCPGCGVSRMCLALLRFDFKAAFYANPAILCLTPVLLAVGVDAVARYIRIGKCRTKGWSTVLLWIATITLLVFGVVRNF